MYKLTFLIDKSVPIIINNIVCYQWRKTFDKIQFPPIKFVIHSMQVLVE